MEWYWTPEQWWLVDRTGEDTRDERKKVGKQQKKTYRGNGCIKDEVNKLNRVAAMVQTTWVAWRTAQENGCQGAQLMQKC